MGRLHHSLKWEYSTFHVKLRINVITSNTKSSRSQGEIAKIAKNAQWNNTFTWNSRSIRSRFLPVWSSRMLLKPNLDRMPCQDRKPSICLGAFRVPHRCEILTPLFETPRNSIIFYMSKMLDTEIGSRSQAVDNWSRICAKLSPTVLLRVAIDSCLVCRDLILRRRCRPFGQGIFWTCRGWSKNVSLLSLLSRFPDSTEAENISRHFALCTSARVRVFAAFVVEFCVIFIFAWLAMFWNLILICLVDFCIWYEPFLSRHTDSRERDVTSVERTTDNGANVNFTVSSLLDRLNERFLES